MSGQKILQGFFIILMLIGLSSIAIAIPGTWGGYAFVDSTIAANGTVVQAFADGSSTASDSYTVGCSGFGCANGAPQGYYRIDVESGIGHNITFKVNGVAIDGKNNTPQPWNSGPQGNVENFNLTMNKSADGAACTFSSGCSGSHCCSGATEYTDGSGTGACQSSACSGGGTTGGGGGGSGGGATTGTGTTVSKQWNSISSGGTATLDISNDKIGFTKIAIVALDYVSSPEIKVTGSVSSSTSPSFSGTVYQFLEVKTTTLTESHISKLTLDFKVEKEWLSVNNFKEEDIVLFRYSNAKWNSLETSIVKRDAKYVYYSAESPGFSYFAIGTTKKAGITKPPVTEKLPVAEQPPVTETPPSGEKPPVTETPPPTEQPPQETEKKASYLYIWILLGVVIVVAVLLSWHVSSLKKTKRRRR